MIQYSLKLMPNRKQEVLLLDWLYHLTGFWNWAVRKIELDVKDHIYHTPYSFHNILAGHSQRLGIPKILLNEGKDQKILTLSLYLRTDK